MDEPTAALSGVEVERLFAVARSLRDEGRGLVFISHRFDEVFALCDTVTVMRDGEYVSTQPIAETTVDQLVSRMVGREVGDLFPKTPAEIGEVVLEVDGLESAGTFHDVSFTVRAGEIVGARRSGRRRAQRDRAGRLRRRLLRRRQRAAVGPHDPAAQPPRGHPGRHGVRPGGPSQAGPGHRELGRAQRRRGDPRGADPVRAAHDGCREPGRGAVGEPGSRSRRAPSTWRPPR